MSFFVIRNVRCAVIKLGGGSVRDHAAAEPLADLAIVFNLSVYDKSSVGRQELGKLAERVTDILQILKEVEMIFLDVEDHADLREKV